jgi:cytochrome c oxidase subunit I+III
MHLTGLLGMPRRVYTYPAGLGWEMLNMISTGGAFMLAIGIFLFLWDLARKLRPSYGDTAGNVWGAGTLEWLPNDTYAARSIPIVTSREPLWDQPRLAEDVREGRYYLPGAPTGRRETVITSPIEGAPQYLMRMPGAGWAPVFAAVFTAAFFLLLTIKLVVAALVCGAIAIAMVVVWMWPSDPEPTQPAAIGGGVTLPTYMSGSTSHSWWAMVVLILVAGSLYLSYVFSYLYLWTVSPQAWPAPGGTGLPEWPWPLASAGLLVVSSAAVWCAGRLLGRDALRRTASGLLVALAAVALCVALATELAGHWQAGVRPQVSSYSAMVYMAGFLQFELVAALVVMALFVLARLAAGRLDGVWRVTFDNTALLWYYTAAQGLVGLLLVHGFPRLAG